MADRPTDRPTGRNTDPGQALIDLRRILAGEKAPTQEPALNKTTLEDQEKIQATLMSAASRFNGLMLRVLDRAGAQATDVVAATSAFTEIVNQLETTFQEVAEIVRMDRIAHAQAMEEMKAQVATAKHRGALLSEQLTALADRVNVDALTNAWNVAALKEMGPNAFKAAQEKKTPLSVVCIDLDKFKAINDTYGHNAGNHVLQEFTAITVKKLLRPSDLFFRTGGDEFVVVLNETDLEGAVKVAERIRVTFEEFAKQKTITYQDNPLEFYTTLGVAELDSYTDHEFNDLLRRADEAETEAKKTRNIVYRTINGDTGEKPHHDPVKSDKERVKVPKRGARKKKEPATETETNPLAAEKGPAKKGATKRQGKTEPDEKVPPTGKLH